MNGSRLSSLAAVFLLSLAPASNVVAAGRADRATCHEREYREMLESGILAECEQDNIHWCEQGFFMKGLSCEEVRRTRDHFFVCLSVDTHLPAHVLAPFLSSQRSCAYMRPKGKPHPGCIVYTITHHGFAQRV